jgi:hypothetical protein
MVSLLWLRAMAMIAGASGVVSRTIRRFAAILRWMIHAGTHDAAVQRCGCRRLKDVFMAKAETAFTIRRHGAVDR